MVKATNLSKIAQGFNDIGESLDKWTVGMKVIKETFKKDLLEKQKTLYEQQGKTLANKEGLIRAYKLFKEVQNVGKMAIAPFNAMLSVMDMFGVAQPILDALSGVFAIIGGNMLQAMMPALEDFFEILFSDEMMEIWEMLGEAIGTFLSMIMMAINAFIGDPVFQKVLKKVIGAFLEIGKVLLMVVTAIMGAVSQLSAGELGAIIYALLVFMAFMKGMALGGETFGVYLGALFAGIAAVALSPLLGLAKGGIVTRPMIAMIGESGPEAVIPLSESGGAGFGMGNDEMLWATEANGRRLDRLIGALETQNKIKRLKML